MESRQISSFLPNKIWDRFLAIPCYGEDQLLPNTLASLKKASTKRETILLCLTINEKHSSPKEIKDSNRKTVAWLKRQFQFSQIADNISYAEAETFDILLINRCEDFAFPEKQGVGLARKIGNDIGASLFHEGRLISPWLHNTDGDAQIPTDYFDQVRDLPLNKNISAVLFQYEHVHQAGITAESHWKAAIFYEIWLRYYVAGLAFAGSLYAFPTIGSTITIHAGKYTQAHGFPKKSAGEDFYLLNKLAKIGKIKYLMGSPIKLIDRYSNRVPFGTGQGTGKIEEQSREGDSYDIYDPKIFEILKRFLQAIGQVYSKKDYQCLTSLEKHLNPTELKTLWKFCQLSELEKEVIASQKRAGPTGSAWAQFQHWFDAFRILKFIHHFRDHLYPSLPIQSAISNAEFLDIGDQVEPFDILRHLRLKEKNTCNQMDQ